MVNLLRRLVGDPNERALNQLWPTVRLAEQCSDELLNETVEQLRDRTLEFRSRIEMGETLDDFLPEALAVAREGIARHTGERAYDVQLLGAVALHRGSIAEMKTGEGKTLVAALALYVNALSGEGAHLITVNDYLARRDAQWYGGALNALGFEFPTTDQRSISPPIPAGWSAISRVEGGISPGFPPIRIACDVTNPLVGPRGAAATYGPQKGLQPEDLARLDGESGRLARLLCARCGQPESVMETAGAGAAGGIAFGLMAAAGARLLSGFDLVSAWLDVDARLARADLVITGEGRFDASSFNGKGPGAIAARAIALGKSTHVFAGSLGHGLSSSSDEKKNLTLHAISPPHLELADALRAAPANLAAAVRAAF